MSITDYSFRPTRVEISLDALRHNIDAFRTALKNQSMPVEIMAVVKANAYGHGAVKIAEAAVRFGVKYLAVAILEEALELRAAGITVPILVLGYTSPEGVPLAVEKDISLTVFSQEVMDALEAYMHHALLETAKIHIKIDTGMGRLGIHYTDDVIGFIDRALLLPGVQVEGLFTHYACADEQDKSYTIEQHTRFSNIVNHYRKQGVQFPYVHAGNSATAIDTPELTYNMARLGISMYGLYPSAEVNRQTIKLKPVMSFITAVSMLKSLPPHSGVSYGGKYVTQADEQFAAIPVGYADGYSRFLSGKAEVLIRGHRAAVAGVICMDQCMINVSSFDDVAVGEEVVLFGRQGNEVISVDELADHLNTINYEVTCQIAHRVPRVYI